MKLIFRILNLSNNLEIFINKKAKTRGNIDYTNYYTIIKH